MDPFLCFLARRLITQTSVRHYGSMRATTWRLLLWQLSASAMYYWKCVGSLMWYGGEKGLQAGDSLFTGSPRQEAWFCKFFLDKQNFQTPNADWTVKMHEGNKNLLYQTLLHWRETLSSFDQLISSLSLTNHNPKRHLKTSNFLKARILFSRRANLPQAWFAWYMKLFC